MNVIEGSLILTNLTVDYATLKTELIIVIVNDCVFCSFLCIDLIYVISVDIADVICVIIFLPIPSNLNKSSNSNNAFTVSSIF